MAFVIAETCIGTKDTACVDVCPVDCIHPAKGRTYDDGRPTFDQVPQLYIDPTECIDCGACVPVCPVTAIFPLDDLPEKWHAYIEINKNYVDGGSFSPKSIKKQVVSSLPDEVINHQKNRRNSGVFQETILTWGRAS
ncbi:MAG: ferredoxin family protein [Candidatus Acidiferrales bacterium]